jgi:hypothetical protein
MFDFSAPVNNVDRGNFALKEFHNYCTLRYPAVYKATFQELKDYLSKKINFPEWIGAEIVARNMSDDQVISAMHSLADWWRGQFLANQEPRWRTELDRIANQSLWGSVKDYVSDTVSTAIDTEVAGYGELKTGVKTVVADTAEIAVDTTKTVVGGLSTYLIVGAVLIGGLIWVAGKSGALRVSKAV